MIRGFPRVALGGSQKYSAKNSITLLFGFQNPAKALTLDKSWADGEPLDDIAHLKIRSVSLRRLEVSGAQTLQHAIIYAMGGWEQFFKKPIRAPLLRKTLECIPDGGQCAPAVGPAPRVIPPSFRAARKENRPSSSLADRTTSW